MHKINHFAVMSATKLLGASMLNSINKLASTDYLIRDILKRHVLAHNGAESGVKRYKRMSNAAPRVSQACKACAGSKLKCDEDASCRRCVAKGIACERDTRFTEIGEKTSPGTSIQSTIGENIVCGLVRKLIVNPTRSRTVDTSLGTESFELVRR
jgi:hypothetical protein